MNCTMEPRDDVAKGLSTDIERLIMRFKNKDNIRFSSFIELWKEEKFSFFFCGKRHIPDLLFFTSEAFRIIVPYTSTRNLFQIRIGALYCLYAIYYLNPLSIRLKIRISLEEWQDLSDLEEVLTKKQHYDAAYIFYQMIYNGAFHLVAQPLMHDYYWPTKSEPNRINDDEEPEDRVSDVLSDFNIQETTVLLQEYNAKKAELLKESRNDKSLGLVERGFIDGLKRTAAGEPTRQQGARPSTEAAAATESSATATVGSRRRMIKEKAFGGSMLQARPVRPVRPVASETPAQDSPSEPNGGQSVLQRALQDEPSVPRRTSQRISQPRRSKDD